VEVVMVGGSFGGAGTQARLPVFAVEGLYLLRHAPLALVPSLALDERRYTTRQHQF
jgi:hypothetical protein